MSGNSKTYHKMSTYKKFKVFVTLHRKMVALSIFSKIFQKFTLFGRYYLTLQNTRQLFSLVCVICVKSNEVVANPGYQNVCRNLRMCMSVLGHHDLFQLLCQLSATWFSFGFISKNQNDMEKKLSEKKKLLYKWKEIHENEQNKNNTKTK